VCCFLHIQTFLCLAQNKTENGFKNGLWEIYKNNGQTKVRCYYLRDTLHGEYMEFSTLTGRKSLEANYHEGVLNGVFRTYWESGEIWNEGFYQNGKLNGRFKFYERNGHLIYYLHYKNGMLDGLCESYYWSGNLEQQFWYKKGFRTDTSIWFDPKSKYSCITIRDKEQIPIVFHLRTINRKPICSWNMRDLLSDAIDAYQVNVIYKKSFLSKEMKMIGWKYIHKKKKEVIDIYYLSQCKKGDKKKKDGALPRSRDSSIKL
jgi:MORN repeat variant